KAEGGYVVGPQSVVAGGTWRVASDKPIRSITPAEFAEVLDFLVPDPGASQAVVADVKENRVSRAAGNRTSHKSGTATSPDAAVRVGVGIPALPARVFSSTEVVSFYNRRVDAGNGRNKSLFDAARRARDCGYSESQVLDVLVPVHVGAQPSEDHRCES